jgi:hypothetical protein
MDAFDLRMEKSVAEPIVQRESAEFETGETLAETAPL